MSSDMGTFRVYLEIENPARPGTRRKLDGVLVDTRAELSWVPSNVLEGLNPRVERVARTLVDAGPAPAAVVSTSSP